MKIKNLKEKLKVKVKRKISRLTTGELTYSVLHRVEDLTLGYVNFIKNTIESNKTAIKDATARLRWLSKPNNDNNEEDLKIMKEKIGGEIFDIVKN